MVVVQSEDDIGLDRLAGVWQDLDLRLVRPDRGEALPSARAIGGGLVVLGGRRCALDDDPWLVGLRALMAEVAGRGTPLLGLCLGAQLLAVACGGDVERGRPGRRTAGVVTVEWSDAARRDPVVGAVARSGGGAAGRSLVAQMHADRVSRLPVGAEHLASSPGCPYEAFRVGRAWGLQFHPEASPEAVLGWAGRYADVDQRAVAEQLAAAGPELGAVTASIAAGWAGVVRERTTGAG